MPQCNGHPVEPACYIEGHWGQYGLDRMAEIAEAFGWEPLTPMHDPRVQRQAADAADEAGRAEQAAQHWEWHARAADDIEDWLNEHTPPTCPHCGRAMFATSDGFYRHVDYPNAVMAAKIECITATDTPVRWIWEWHEGEFYLTELEEAEEW